MIKDIKPSALARQVKRLQKQLDAAAELRQSQTHAHEKYRAHAAETLAAHLARIRALELERDQLKDHAIKDAFRLNDYRDQIAIQQRMVAEAKHDATNASRANLELAAQGRDERNRVHKLQVELDHAEHGRQEWFDMYRQLRDKTPLWRIAWDRFARWAND